jgi:hypothetical protein
MAVEPATLTNLDTGERFEVLFNPAEYTLNKENTFAQAAIPGLSSPLLQFVHGNLRTLDMELFFDTYERHVRGGRQLNPALADVRTLTQGVADLAAINPETHAPPIVLFAWGELTFTGVLAHVSQRFTMFLESGIPVRATLQVSFQEFKTALDEQRETKRRTADYTRMHELGEGEALSALAGRVYGDAAKWRPIAIANEVDDPLRVPAGTPLLVPPLPFRDPTTGEVHA